MCYFTVIHSNSARHCVLFTMEYLGASKSVGNNNLSEDVDAASSSESADVVAAGSIDAQSGVVCSTTLDGEVVVLNEFLHVWVENSMSYEDITNTTDKFFRKRENIVDFVDSKLKETWRVMEKFDKWLANQDLSKHIYPPFVEKIFEEVGVTKGGTMLYSVSMIKTLFDINDGNKALRGGLSKSDLNFLNLMADSSQFICLKNPDLIIYAKEGQCHKESVRLIQKYDSSDVDIDLIAEGWPKQTKRRSLEIAIFISQYFGRAERIMNDCNVKVLWDSLVFIDHLLKIVEVQCKPTRQATIMGGEHSIDDTTSICGDYELDTGSKAVQLGRPPPHSKRKSETTLNPERPKMQKTAMISVSSVIMWLFHFFCFTFMFLIKMNLSRTNVSYLNQSQH